MNKCGNLEIDALAYRYSQCSRRSTGVNVVAAPSASNQTSGGILNIVVRSYLVKGHNNTVDDIIVIKITYIQCTARS